MYMKGTVGALFKARLNICSEHSHRRRTKWMISVDHIIKSTDVDDLTSVHHITKPTDAGVPGVECTFVL